MTQVHLKLKSAEFRRSHEESWARLELLLARAEGSGAGSGVGSRATGFDDAERLELLTRYRQAVSSLAVARQISLDRDVITYLEALCARAHLSIYRPRQRLSEVAQTLLIRDVYQALDQHRGYIWASALLLLGGGVIGFIAVTLHTETYTLFVTPEYALGRDPSLSTELLNSRLHEARHSVMAHMIFGSGLFTYHAKVGICCVALGVFGGVPTMYLLVTQGMLLGAFTGLYHSRGLSWDVWGCLLPHGVTGLLALTLCGAVGLMMGRAVLSPGRYTRMRELTTQIKRSAPLMIIAILMFLIAGQTEELLSRATVDLNTRYLISASVISVWLIYFGGAWLKMTKTTRRSS